MTRKQLAKELIPKQKNKLEFSKKLTIIDVITWVFLSLILAIILLIRPELGTFVQNIFAYITTAYVSLRLGYTAKAGVENYKKIAENYKAIAELAQPDNDCEPNDYTSDEEIFG